MGKENMHKGASFKNYLIMFFQMVVTYAKTKIAV